MRRGDKLKKNTKTKMLFTSTLTSSAKTILENLRDKNLKLTTAESCTGGLVSALFTSVAGSSDVFERGFVTYSNEAKIEMLGVKKETLEEFGAVSFDVAREMSIGAIKNSKANIAIAITGIAGPNSDNTKKEVGLVYIAITSQSPIVTPSHDGVHLPEIKTQVRKFNFSGDRDEVRKASVIAALEILKQKNL